ncbi:MAG: hypothetical protein ACK56I_03045, partial [bacterium]
MRLDGSVVCWGSNGSGQSTVPASLFDVTEVAGGEFHSAALKADGTVVCWGVPGHSMSTVPTGLGQVRKLSANFYNTVALRTVPSCTGDLNNDGMVGASDLP